MKTTFKINLENLVKVIIIYHSILFLLIRGGKINPGQFRHRTMGVKVISVTEFN